MNLHNFRYRSQTHSGSSQYEWSDILSAFFVLGILVAIIFIIPYFRAKRSKFTFVDELLFLIAYVIKIDKNIDVKEKVFAENLLEKEFGKKQSKIYMHKLNVLLERNYSIKSVLKIIDYKESKPIKIQLLNNLIKITVIDGYLSTKEFNVLSEICSGLGLRPVRLTSMLAMYNYITEEAHKQSFHKNHKRNRTESKLNVAYKVLGIDQLATDKLIKKAYRKLVILYHPDKIGHLDNDFKKSAKKEFLKINEAYDLLKENRGFK